MRVIAALVMLVSVLVTQPVSAGFEAGDYYPTVTGGVINGNGENDDAKIAAARFGLVHYFRERLGFFSEAAAFRPSGTREGIDVNTTGMGAGFGLRWHFFQRARFGLYAEWGAGFMVAKDVFPPGGTKLNGASHFGAGVSADVGSGLVLLTGLRQMHVSNGKGLVENNPSFDGLGGYAGLAFRPGYRSPFPPVKESLWFGGNGLRWRAETTLEFGDEDDSPGGGVSVDLPLVRGPGLRSQLAFTAGELVGETIWMGSVRVYRETEAGRVVLGYSRQEFNVFASDIYHLQLERILNDVSTVMGLASYEEKNLADDRVFGGLFITVYPAPFAAINTGVGFERQQAEFFNSIANLNDAGFNLGVEIAPGFLARLGLSGFFNIGIGYDTQLAGIRFQPDGTRSLVERHRRGPLMMVR